MAQPQEKTARKRKHATAEVGLGAEPSTKRAKKDKSGKAKKDKDKAGRAQGEFRVVQAVLAVSISPVFANNLRAGVDEMLDSMLMRYIPALQGVVLAHDNLRFLDSTAAIKADCPFANCRVAFDATVWSPQVGMKLVGRVNLCSPDHVSLLVHRTFNVSIPRHHIPVAEWEFEYGPVANDPEFGAAAAEGEVLPNESGEDIPQEDAEGGGRWVHKVTATKLGGSKGYVEFTVVGLTIANQMLSLVGSVQLDPFSPEHVPSHQTAAASTSQVNRAQAELEEPEADPALDDFPNGGSDSEEDTFEMLGRRGDEAVARDAERRAKEEEAAKKERKRKRKEAKLQAADGTDVAADRPPKEKKAKRKKKS